jgi:hypothetical protein
VFCNAVRASVVTDLEAEDLVLELADRLRFGVSQTLGGLLHRTDHRRRPADKDLDVLSRSWKLGLDHIRSNKASATSPLLRWVVEHVVHAELAILSDQRIQILFQQNILRVDVRKDEVDLCDIASRATADNGLDYLQHGCDASSASDHTEMPNHVWGVHHGALGTLDLHCLSDHERCDVSRDVAGRVRFDEEVEVALVIVGGDRGIGADDFFAFDGGCEGDVLADWQTKDVFLVGELESVAGKRLAEKRYEKLSRRTWRCCVKEWSSP